MKTVGENESPNVSSRTHSAATRNMIIRQTSCCSSKPDTCTLLWNSLRSHVDRDHFTWRVHTRTHTLWNRFHKQCVIGQGGCIQGVSLSWEMHQYCLQQLYLPWQHPKQWVQRPVLLVGLTQGASDCVELQQWLSEWMDKNRNNQL